MRRHGATVVGGNLRQVVFRTIYSCRNAEYQTAAKLIGKVGTLTPGEAEMAGQLHAQPNTIARAWEYWLTRLDKAGAMPLRERAAPARKAASARKPAAKTQPGKSKQTKSKPAKGKRR
jgi:HCOMODA/2-hydroxy-3-carboxy-muconic semialdehyde decarboxylase